MITIQGLLTAAKSRAAVPSNYRLARVLAVSDNTLNRWQHAKGLPDDAMAARLAEMAGLDPDYVVASMHAQRAAETAERVIWERIARRLEGASAPACCAILALCITALFGGSDAYAAQPLDNFFTVYTLASVFMMTRLIHRLSLRRPV